MTFTITRRPLGRTGLEVSEIGFGALEIGRDWAADVNPGSHAAPTFAEAERTLNGVLDLGINLIDTAPAYWDSEDFIGRALAHRRGEYVLATKVGEHCDRSGSKYDYSAEATRDFIDESLRRLRTDHIDLLQIHSASIEVLERGETWGAMDEARRAGKVRFLGMTGGVAPAVRAIELGGYDTVQVPYHLLNIEANERLFALAEERGVGVLIMRSLAGGKLTAKFERHADAAVRDAIRTFLELTPGGSPDELAGVALKFALAPRTVTSLLVGSRSTDRLKGSIAAARGTLDPATIERAKQLSRAISLRVW